MSGGLSLTPQGLKEGERASLIVDSEVKHSLGPLPPETKSIKTLPGMTSFIQALQNRYMHKDYAYLKRLLYEDTFPIQESFINLALVKEEEQKAKEKELKETKGDTKSDEKRSHSLRDGLLLSYETLHAPKERIELSKLFNLQKGDSKEAPKRLLIEGRAGIGKTTLCQYLAYQWAVREREPTNPLKGWPKPFSAVIWLPLRRLNEYKDSDVSLPKVAHRECLLEEDQQRLSVEDISTYLKQLEDSHEVLYLLDGYDELDVKEAKESKEGKAYRTLLSSLWNKEWCIVTTRPYYVSNHTLWPREQYRRLENIGFVDENVKAYVKRFFQDFREEKRGEEVLQSFERYPMIKGLGHVPILLELICSMWKEKSFKEEAPDTLTHLYQEVTQCLLKRYLQRQQENVTLLTASEIEEHPRVRGPLSFLEELAWRGMQQQGLILKPETYSSLIQIYCPLVKDRALFLETVFKQLGFLKGVGEPKSSLMEQEYYFIHLTFQEFFAARYLVNSLKEPPHSKRYQEAIQFIRKDKYHPRYSIMLSFTAGLLSSSKIQDDMTFIHRFWDTLTSEPHDLTGAGHLRLIMTCLEEARCDGRISYQDALLKEVGAWLKVSMEKAQLFGWILPFLQEHGYVVRHSDVLRHLEEVLLNKGEIVPSAIRAVGQTGPSAASPDILNEVAKLSAVRAVGQIGPSAASPGILKVLVELLDKKRGDTMRSPAARALGQLGPLAARADVLKALVSLLRDNEKVRSSAGYAIGRLGSSAPAASLDILLNDLLPLLSDEKGYVKSLAVDVLGQLGPLAARANVLKALVSLLSNKEEEYVRYLAARAIGQLGSLAPAASLDILLNDLVPLLHDGAAYVRSSAVRAVGQLGPLAARPDILKALVSLLNDREWGVRSSTAYAVGRLGSSAANSDILNALVVLLNDKEGDVGSWAVYAVGLLGPLAASSNILNRLVELLSDEKEGMRSYAAHALSRLGFSAASDILSNILNALVKLLSHTKRGVRSSAADAVGRLGSSAVRPDILNALVKLLIDEKEDMRSSAADAVGRLGSPAARSDILKALVVLLNDKEGDVRSSAAHALGQMSSADKLTEVFKDFLEILRKESGLNLSKKEERLTPLMNIIGLTSTALGFLKEEEVNLLSQNNIILDVTPFSELVSVYIEKGYPSWALLIAKRAFNKGESLILNDRAIMIYDGKGDTSFPLPFEKRSTLRESLTQAFAKQAKELDLPTPFQGGHSVSARESKKLEAGLSSPLYPPGGFMSGSDSSSSSSEVKAGSSSVQAEDRLRIDFAALRKTSQRIRSEEVGGVIAEVIKHGQEKVEQFNDDIADKDSLGISSSHYIDSLERLISYMTSQREVISKEIEGDSHSKGLAGAILEKILEEVKRVYLLLRPLPSVKPQPTYWQKNRLRLEQQLLLGESKVAQAFRGALAKVATKGSRDYRLPNGVFICYAWPDDKDSREEHLKWVQPFLVELRGHLRAAGIMAKLDIKDGPPGGNIYEYMKGAETSDYVLLIGTESLLKKHEKGVSAVCTELIRINHKRAKDREAKKYRVLPLLISGDYGESFPVHYELYTTMHNWKGSHTYYHHFCWLVRVLYGQESEKCFDKEWSDFLKIVQGGEKIGIVEPLDQKAVLIKMEDEKMQGELERKQQELASRKVLGVSPGDSKSERSDGSSVSDGSSSSLSNAQLMARQRQHDSAYAVTFEGQLAFAEPSSNTRREDEQRKDAGKSFEGKHS